VIDVLDRKVEFVFVSFGVAAIFAAAVGQHAQQLDLVLLVTASRRLVAPYCGTIGRRL
jgi:hypothetical protein